MWGSCRGASYGDHRSGGGEGAGGGKVGIVGARRRYTPFVNNFILRLLSDFVVCLYLQFVSKKTEKLIVNICI